MHFLTDVTVGAVLGAVAIVIGLRLTRRTLCDLDRRTEAQETAAERDRAERDPRRPEAQPRERVAAPVHAQQNP